MEKFQVQIPNRIKDKAVQKLDPVGTHPPTPHIPAQRWEDPKVTPRCLNSSAAVAPFARNTKGKRGGAWTS